MVNINLLPTAQRKQSSGEGQPWLIAAAALAVLTVLSIVGLEFYYSSQINGLQNKYDALNGEIQALTASKNEFDELQARKTELEQVTNVARTLRDQKTYWSNDLAAFTAQLPAGDGLALNSLNMSPAQAQEQSIEMQQGGLGTGTLVGHTLTLAGTARSQQAVIDMLNAFENSNDFGVVFQGMQRGESANGAEEYTFNADVGVAKQVSTDNGSENPVNGTTPATTGGSS